MLNFCLFKTAELNSASSIESISEFALFLLIDFGIL